MQGVLHKGPEELKEILLDTNTIKYKGNVEISKKISRYNMILKLS